MGMNADRWQRQQLAKLMAKPVGTTGTGHRARPSGAGPHDARKNRQRTRHGERSAAIHASVVGL